ncbi:endonuclease MutS2 [Caldalkalibacillus mannanilyticus]|uniref:endonuclease MutS2 n=1 Tax=Caldalkalibacillus mannanilyticus TaxID=1418 RepID=UPI0004686441|nr:endonuclease MutS2 [Caldalkalibacillus mannanilyticus]
MLERVLRVLEYPKVIEQLGQRVSSSLGKEKVNQLKPSFIYEEVKKAQQSTYEGSTVLRLKGYVPFGGVQDIRPSIKRASIGGMLNPSELLDIANTLYGGRQLKLFLEGLLDSVELPILADLASQISSLKPLEQEIKSCIDDQAEVLDSASSALRQIRAQIRTAESRIREKLNQMTRVQSYQKMLQDPIVTIRNDRYCLPVKQEYRANFGGIVHDQSASGATLFIEPEAVVTINNQLREAKLKEEREIEKILRQLSESVSLEVEALSLNIAALADLDFIFAKAQYAKQIRAVQPKLNQEGYFNLKKARHPLIAEDEIVPISFDLGREYTSMIITGPNTGGKTVTLKTLGLLTLMSCSGLAIPAEEGSEIAVVSAVYADIGDEQSIEQSLSTFSSHMTNIVRILAELDHQSLVLFDELGAGTDPTEGAALAMAILDHVYQQGAKVVATTHYSELKAYAYNKDTVMNASVEFDVETLRPTYRLLVGVPGRSNAFSIAKRLGLSEEIIEQAKAQIGEDDSRVETMIASLEENQKLAEKEREEASQLKDEIATLKREIQKKEEQIDKEKEKRIDEAEKAAQEYFTKMMKEADQIITDLREAASNQEVVKEHVLIDAKKRLEAIQEASAGTKSKSKASPATGQAKRSTAQNLKPGDEVYVHSFGQKGHIVEQVSEQEYTVQIGIMKMKVSKAQLEKIKAQKQAIQTPRATVKKSNEPTKMELDLRGQTIDEAIMALDKYLDDAVMDNYHQVYVIHGKGTGQLRKGVQDYLKKHRNVKGMRLGGAGEGGSGVTVVELS